MSSMKDSSVGQSVAAEMTGQESANAPLVNMNIDVTTSTNGDSGRKGSLKRKGSSAVSSSSNNNNNGNGSGNDSENSGIVSLGNNSFGFNFDSEETPPDKSNNGESSDSSSSDPHPAPKNKDKTSTSSSSKSSKLPAVNTAVAAAPMVQESTNPIAPMAATAPLGQPTAAHLAAADAAVANLQSIARANSTPTVSASDSQSVTSSAQHSMSTVSGVAAIAPAHVSVSSASAPPCGAAAPDAAARPRKKSKKPLDDEKREERNAREKERSFRISRQINELRNLLSSGGVIVPKGTKSSVLTEAANYIRMLQQHQYRSEIDRQQLVQQMQMIGGGALGNQAAQAVRHVAAQNGVWSLGNFGGVPPQSAMQFYPNGSTSSSGSTDGSAQADSDAPLTTSIQDPEYRFIFNSCAVGMAIASMGGAFIDCNQLFCQLSSYSKQEVCSLTIFNLTARQDLQHAFDLISEMIAPPVVDGRTTPTGTSGTTTHHPKPCVLRGSMKHRNDIGLSVSLIKGDDGVAKCFCVTLIQNPASPFDTAKPIPATADMILAQQQQAPPAQQQPTAVQQVVAVGAPAAAAAQTKDAEGSVPSSTPAYTTG